MKEERKNFDYKALDNHVDAGCYNYAEEMNPVKGLFYVRRVDESKMNTRLAISPTSLAESFTEIASNDNVFLGVLVAAVGNAGGSRGELGKIIKVLWERHKADIKEVHNIDLSHIVGANDKEPFIGDKPYN